MTAILLFVAAAMAAADISSRMVTWARRRALLDIPNERSSHTTPTPTGAGVGIVAVTLAGTLAAHVFGAARADLGIVILLACGCLIAFVSWLDDHRSISAGARLGVHALAAGVLVGAVGSLNQVPIPGVGVVDLGIAGVVLTIWWLVGSANAFNFMDGIDGIAGTQAAVAGVVWGVAGTAVGQPAIAAMGWLIAGASAGFLRHNWSPAYIFMGDVGAVFLGFVFAALTLIGAKLDFALAAVGFSAVWPFAFDSAFTFARRAWRRENLLRAHRSHLYQRLVIAGWSHSAVTLLYGAASTVSSVAALAVLFRVPHALTLLAVVLVGLALGLWLLTVTEEGRKVRDAEPAAASTGFHHFARNRYILLADVILVVFAAFAAFAIRFDGLFVLHRPEFPLFLAVVFVTKPIVFFAFGLYKRYWRYAGIWDLVAVVLAVSAAGIVVATTVVGIVILQARLFDQFTSFPRSVLLIDWLITLTCAGGVRMSVRVFSESAAGRGPGRTGDAAAAPKRVVIVGAGEAGILVLREIRRSSALQMHVVGFLDDDPAKLGKQIQATPVLGPFSALVAVAAAHKVDEAVIALPSTPGSVVRRVIESCAEAGIASRSVPGMFELLDGHVSISRLRNVEIGDLLRRTQVSSRPGSAGYLAGRCVVVTGAGGSIGSELCSQIVRARPKRLVLLGHGENSIFSVYHDLRERAAGVTIETVIGDVRDARRMKQVFDQLRPAVVFHAAAHKHVPLMEDNPEEAVTNNVFGTRSVVDAALASNVERLVLISTDKAVEPSSVMGATKRIAEKIVMDAARKHDRAFAVVRFGNVLGSRGSVVPVFKRQIELRRPIQITHPDMKRYFMTIPEAVHLVLAAGGLARGGELFVLNMGDPVAIVELAQDVIRLSGCRVEDIPIVFTGLRPGEKLEERLWETGATVESTAHPDVLRVVEPSSDQGDVDEITAFLKSAVETSDASTVVFALSTAVPSLEAVLRARNAEQTST